MRKVAVVLLGVFLLAWWIVGDPNVKKVGPYYYEADCKKDLHNFAPSAYCTYADL